MERNTLLKLRSTLVVAYLAIFVMTTAAAFAEDLPSDTVSISEVPAGAVAIPGGEVLVPSQESPIAVENTVVSFKGSETTEEVVSEEVVSEEVVSEEVVSEEVVSEEVVSEEVVSEEVVSEEVVSEEVVSEEVVMTFTGGTPKPGGSVDLCHATHSGENPYVLVSVAYPSMVFTGHSEHDDIIPPIDFDGDGLYTGSFDYVGLNWDSAGQAIYDNGCVTPEAAVEEAPFEPIVVKICHATLSFPDFYETKYVEYPSLDFSNHYDEGIDFIPPVDFDGDGLYTGPFDFMGMNWDSASQIVYENDCKLSGPTEPGDPAEPVVVKICHVTHVFPDYYTTQYLEYPSPDFLHHHDELIDIIPPIDLDGDGDYTGPFDFPGQNWNIDGKMIYENDCKFPVIGGEETPVELPSMTVDICHATPGETDPYVLMPVEYPSRDFLSHTFEGGDIIAPIDFDADGSYDGEFDYVGLNWDETNEAIYHNACGLPAEVIIPAEEETTTDSTTGDGTEEEEGINVLICHFNMNTLSYSQIHIETISELESHMSSRFDIIPALTAEQYPTDGYAGLNWDEAGQTLFNNDCNPPAEEETPTGGGETPAEEEALDVYICHFNMNTRDYTQVYIETISDLESHMGDVMDIIPVLASGMYPPDGFAGQNMSDPLHIMIYQNGCALVPTEEETGGGETTTGGGGGTTDGGETTTGGTSNGGGSSSGGSSSGHGAGGTNNTNNNNPDVVLTSEPTEDCSYTFIDIDGNPYEYDICYLLHAGVIDGNANDQLHYMPSEETLLFQMNKMLALAGGLIEQTQQEDFASVEEAQATFTAAMEEDNLLPEGFEHGDVLTGSAVISMFTGMGYEAEIKTYLTGEELGVNRDYMAHVVKTIFFGEE